MVPVPPSADNRMCEFDVEGEGRSAWGDNAENTYEAEPSFTSSEDCSQDDETCSTYKASQDITALDISGPIFADEVPPSSWCDDFETQSTLSFESITPRHSPTAEGTKRRVKVAGYETVSEASSGGFPGHLQRQRLRPSQPEQNCCRHPAATVSRGAQSGISTGQRRAIARVNARVLKERSRLIPGRRGRRRLGSSGTRSHAAVQRSRATIEHPKQWDCSATKRIDETAPSKRNDRESSDFALGERAQRLEELRLKTVERARRARLESRNRLRAKKEAKAKQKGTSRVGNQLQTLQRPSANSQKRVQEQRPCVSPTTDPSECIKRSERPIKRVPDGAQNVQLQTKHEFNSRKAAASQHKGAADVTNNKRPVMQLPTTEHKKTPLERCQEQWPSVSRPASPKVCLQPPQHEVARPPLELAKEMDVSKSFCERSDGEIVTTFLRPDWDEQLRPPNTKTRSTSPFDLKKVHNALTRFYTLHGEGCQQANQAIAWHTRNQKGASPCCSQSELVASEGTACARHLNVDQGCSLAIHARDTAFEEITNLARSVTNLVQTFGRSAAGDYSRDDATAATCNRRHCKDGTAPLDLNETRLSTGRPQGNNNSREFCQRQEDVLNKLESPMRRIEVEEQVLRTGLSAAPSPAEPSSTGAAAGALPRNKKVNPDALEATLDGHNGMQRPGRQEKQGIYFSTVERVGSKHNNVELESPVRFVRDRQHVASGLPESQPMRLELSPTFCDRVWHHVDSFRRHREVKEATISQSGMTQNRVVEMISEEVMNGLLDSVVNELDETLKECAKSVFDNL